MATVQNPGFPGAPVDLAIGNKYATSAFRFNGLSTVKVAVTTASQPVQLIRNFAGDNTIRVWNSGASPIRLRFGRDNSVVALPTDKAVPPGAIELFTIGTNVNWVAVIGDAASSAEFDCGSGV